MAIGNVVKMLRTKNASGFSSPSYIGAEQYFVSPIRGSSSNNLEEQLLIGIDCETTSWTEADGTKRITKEFRKEDTVSNYYKLEIYQYTNSSILEEYIGYVDGVLSFKINEADVDTTEIDDGVLKIENSSIYGLDAEDRLTVNPVMTAELQELYFVSDTDVTLVTTKRILKIFNDGNEIVKEIITNQL